MTTRGIRGAITVENNSIFAIKEATMELLNEIISKNNIKTEDISCAVFTMTNDLDAAYPAKFARENCDFKYVPMMCYTELNVKNSLKKCLRILLNINTNKTQKEINHIYLKGAKKLRQDLNNFDKGN